MTPEIKSNPPQSDRHPGKWFDRLLDGTHNHYTCYLPENPGRLADLILKLFYSGIKVDKSVATITQRIEKNAVVVYVTKFESYFEYLFYYNRFRHSKIPAPQIGFDYQVLLWQPISRLTKIFLAHFHFFVRHLRFPDPYKSDYIKQELLEGRSGFFSLVSKKGFYRRFVKAETDPLQYLLEIQKTTGRPIYIVPLLMLFSKKPHRASPNLLDMLLGPEDKPGRIRRLVSLFRNPGRIFVEASPPLNLKSFLLAGDIGHRSTEFQSLILRRDLLRQLNRHRQSITGPVLKSHQELIENILTGERFRQFIADHSANRGLPLHEVRKKAAAYLEEIAANYRPAFIKIASYIVEWILNTMYDGVTVNTDVLSHVKSMSLRGPLVFLPCHKSHFDYLILSYLLYQNNMPCPHIAAGKNLSFWPLGPLFRSGGAFFLRRSFRGAVLYSKVFAEYIYKLLEEGFNIEQFIEGGRSRTGKLLMPKLGLLSILLNAYKNGACEDMIFVPIYIGYDRVLEESAYLNELEGGQKKAENFRQVISARKFLKKRYGKIYIQFHDPISLRQLLDKYGKSLEQIPPKELNALCRNLGHRIIHAINRVAVVTPHSLAAAAILNGSGDQFSVSQLMATCEIYMHHLTRQNATLADTLVLDHRHALEQVLEAYTQRKFIEPAGDKKDAAADPIYAINVEKRPHLEYYKNNCIAFFIPAALTAIAILEKDAFQFCGADLHAGYIFWRDFFKYEFTYDVDQAPEYYVRKAIKAFIEDAILIPHRNLPDTYNLTSAGFRKMKLFSTFLKTYFESYWIVLSFFKHNPRADVHAKERLKKIEARGHRMYKRKEIERREALSKISYQNAVDFFTSRGIKSANDAEQIEFYAAAIKRARQHL